MDSFAEEVLNLVEKDDEVVKEEETQEEALEGEAKVLSKEQQDLVDAERWGKMRRWNEVEYVHRMRNLRSQVVYGMQKSRLEKLMERQFLLKDKNREEDANIIYKYHI